MSFYSRVLSLGLCLIVGSLAFAGEPKEAPGNWLTGTIAVGGSTLSEAGVKKLKEAGGVTLKGLVIRLGDKKEAAVCFDTELVRMSGGWTGGFVTPMKLMSRGEFPTAKGEIAFTTKVVPGFSKDGKFDDPRAKQLGPLPPDWAKYRGFYVHGEKIILSYTVGGSQVLELPAFDSVKGQFTRSIQIVNSKNAEADFKALAAKMAEHGGAKPPVVVASSELEKLTRGGPLNWPEVIETKGELGKSDNAYTVDTLTVPYKNTYNSEFLIAGLDFFSDGRIAICTFHGDVWIVSGMDEKLEQLKWKRFAAGLYHPLGLKIVKDQVYTLGRDQITKLHDSNADGEADFYENFNNDIYITTNFHEFAFDLQTDAQGNYYFSKGSPVRGGGRGFQEIVDHHGSVLKVTPDGKTMSVVATGFRAPNGIGMGPNGELSSGDNEGTWMPMCRLNLIKQGGFYGVPPVSHRDPPPSDYDRPICWFPKDVDNSSGGQVWDITGGKFGPFAGHMFHLSYGTCRLYHVMQEEIDGVPQGGVVRMPVSFNSGILRARFNSKDNHMYLCGMKGWQTSGTMIGGLQRVRYTGKPVNMPHAMHVQSNGIKVTFTNPLDAESVKDVQNYGIEQWNYVWSAAYGSPEISAKKTSLGAEDGKEWSKEQIRASQRDTVIVKSASLLEDKKTVFLEIPDLQPVMQMKIKFNLKAADGSSIKQEIISTINKLGTR